MKKATNLLLLIISLFIISGCEDPVSDDSNKSTPIPEGFARISGQLTTLAGINDAELAYVDIFVIGQDSNKVESGYNGDFSIDVQLQEEEENYEYQLIVLSKSKAFGKKFDIDELNEGEEKSLDDAAISQTGSLSGTALLENQADHTGINIYIPGTSFSALSDQQGNYIMSHVPEGTYDIVRADKNGYYFAALDNIKAYSDSTVTLPDMMLNLSTGAIGGMQINNGDTYSTSLTVELDIYSTNDAVLMMISENENMFGGSWKPISPRDNFTFTYEGDKTLYIRFADENGLESSIYYDSIIINTNPLVSLLSPIGTTVETKPILDWSDASMSDVTYALQLSKDANFSELLIDKGGLTESSYTIEEVLDNQTGYYWRVCITKNGNNDEFSWASTFFTVDIGTSHITNPSYEEIVAGLTPTFNWQPINYASSYELEINTSEDFSSDPVICETNLTTTEYQLTDPLSEETEYYSRIRYYNSDNVASKWSSTCNFQVMEATEISGYISSNTTWTKQDSPYYITDVTRVTEGITLIIEPGVSVYFKEKESLRIDGTLIARGTEFDRITITAQKPENGHWGNILFTPTSVGASYDNDEKYISGSILEYCDISFGGKAEDTGIIQLNKSNPYVNHCVISNSSQYGILIEKVVSDFFLKIDNCTIENNIKNGINIDNLNGVSENIKTKILHNKICNNQSHGIFISVQGNVTISNNEISDNVGSGVEIEYGDSCNLTSNLIENNSRLTDDYGYNYGGGISVYAVKTCHISSNTIRNNVGLKGGGIFFSDAHSILSTYVTYNRIEGNRADKGGAVYLFKDEGGTMKFEHNFIKDNTSSNSIVFYAGNNHGHVIKHNTFVDNKDYASLPTTLMISKPYSSYSWVSIPAVNNNNFVNPDNLYEMRTNNQSGADNIDASNNWFGTADENEIKEKIYDSFDDGSLSEISYTPFLTQPDPDAPAIEE